MCRFSTKLCSVKVNALFIYRALVTEGIQRGHMSLHARNIAISAGAPSHAVEECVIFMIQTGRINHDAAVEYLAAHELQTRINLSHEKTYSVNTRPSMFYFEIDSDKSNGISLNISFPTFGLLPVTLLFTSNELNNDPLTQALFGVNNYSWVVSILNLLDQIELSTVKPTRSKASQSRKLKFISILMNIVTRRLLIRNPLIMEQFVRDNFACMSNEIRSPSVILTSLLDGFGSEADSMLSVGLSFLLALWQVFQFRVGNVYNFNFQLNGSVFHFYPIKF
jgi:hypothetical protein